MSDDALSAITSLNSTVLDPKVIRRSGSGKAFQSVSQSTAIAVQDAVDNLRNISTISTTAVGVAMAKYIETENPLYLTMIQAAQGLIDTATTQLGTIGSTAATVLDGFPSD